MELEDGSKAALPGLPIKWNKIDAGYGIDRDYQNGRGDRRNQV